MTTRSSRRWIAASGGLILAASLALPATADIETLDTSDVAALKAQIAQAAAAKLKMTETEGRVTAFVELTTPTTVEQSKSKPASSSAVAKQVEAKTQQVKAALEDPQATVLYTTKNAIAGFAVEGDAEAINKLAERDDVKAIRPLTIHTTNNAATTDFTRAVEAWKSTGKTGKDVTIAVIDSGVDFTHTTFGGSGDYTAYADKKARAKAPTWPQGKVIGGWDFVGEDYWGSAASRVHPDGNPIDVPDDHCDAPSTIGRTGGHGSHVAGTAAGFGVNADGTTYQDGYQNLTSEDVMKMKVGPGSAPEANILAFKVFGCAGSTAYVQAALDSLLEQENGKYKWDADVVNMSLGSDYSPAADPENVVIQKLMEERGIISVVASGNALDLWDVGGAPGNSPASLTVANSIHSVMTLDQATFNYAEGDHKLLGQYSVNYEWPEALIGPLEIVKLEGTNAEACEALSAEDAAKVKGKAVMIDWVENPKLKCGSKARFDNVEKAGGKGVILPSDVSSFRGGIAGNTTLPGIQLLKDGTQDLNTAVAAGKVSVTFDHNLANSAHITNDELGDTLNFSSSRGVHGSFGIVKPDVAAPGTNIMSAGVGTGSEAAAMTGTSMATPHVAGITALVKEAKPKWNAIQIKADVMNTAFHDVRSGSNTYGPQRVGSGRVDSLAAVKNDVVMYDSANPQLASVNFGVVEFTKDGFSADHKVTIENLGSDAASLNLSYQAATVVPGVTYTVAPSTVTIPAGGKQEVTVTATIDAAKFQKTLDPTMESHHTFSDLKIAREFIATATGRLVAKGNTSMGDGELRLPVSMAPKPVSELTSKLVMDDAATTAQIHTTGNSFAHKSALEYTSDLVPLAMPFEHVAHSDEKNLAPEDMAMADAIRATDIKDVGVRVVPATPKPAEDGVPPITEKNSQVIVGVETYGPWAIMPVGPTQIVLEVKAKGKTYTVEPLRIEETDIVLNGVFDERGKIQGISFRNDWADSTLDTNTMDTRVVALPFELGSVGFTDEEVKAGDLPLEVTVIGKSWYAPLSTDDGYSRGDTDRVTFSYNAGNPTYTFTTHQKDTALEIDGNPIDVTINDAAATAGGTSVNATAGDVAAHDQKIMMIHFHNKVGDQVELLPVVSPEPAPSESPTADPTVDPTTAPTDEPTTAPTHEPTAAPTDQPTDQPTAKPTGPGKPPLPITGSDMAIPGLIALGLLSAGGALAIRKRAAQQ